MARIDNLTNYLTDVATAIKYKKGDNTPIAAEDFDIEIENLPSGGEDWSDIGYNNEPQSITNMHNITKSAYDNWDNSSTSIGDYFYTNYNDISILPIIDTSNVTDFKYGFKLNNIFSFPLLDTSSGTDFSYMFNGAKSLRSIAQIDTSSGINFSHMFSGCSSLTTVPQIDTSNATDVSYMFYSCESLTTIPQIDTSNVTGVGLVHMFEECKSLLSVPEIDTSNASSLTRMFYMCQNIVTIPELDASKMTGTTLTFGQCVKLQNFGGLKNYGQALPTTISTHDSNYTYDLSECLVLSHDSVLNVINKVYDIKSKGCKSQYLKLKKAVYDLLTAEEIEIATNKGWDIIGVS